MSGVGPVEPGEGTRPREDDGPVRIGAVRRRAARLPARGRRAAIGALTAAALLAAGGVLYATRPSAPQQTTAAPPFPSQVVDVRYVGPLTVPPGTRPRTFAFEVLLGVATGPPVTTTGLGQPYPGISLSSSPRVPFRTAAGTTRKVTLAMHVTECGKVPGKVGLPFLDVTLRNKRAMQAHSFILGSRYARDLSQALEVACSNESR
ncbi:Tat pathway signal sequence domain protein [Streptomyces sp. NPDC086091]|uniref:Tat pathway signal sequence domain protein n=1 Tax=Streptomyces sp. NPDC086091 TaxID=3365751 RepID=UPI00382817FF